MGTPDNLATNAGLVANTDYYSTDRVIYADGTWSIFPTNSLGEQTISVTPAHHISTSSGDTVVLPLGIYSYDGGTTWNDIGYSIPGGSLTHNPSSILPSVGLSVTYTPGTGVINFNTIVNATVGGGSQITVYVKLILLDSNTGATLTGFPANTAKISNTSALADATPVQYRQINLASVETMDGDSNTTTVTHGQSSIPIIFYWPYKTSGGTTDFGDMSYQTGSTIRGNFWDSRNLPPGSGTQNEPGVAMDATNIYLKHRTGWTLNKYYYRVYKEL